MRSALKKYIAPLLCLCLLLALCACGEHPAKEPKVSASAPTPAPSGPKIAVELPALTEEGFLADENAEPFIHADRSDGHWYYITQDIYLEIIRYKNEQRKDYDLAKLLYAKIHNEQF